LGRWLPSLLLPRQASRLIPLTSVYSLFTAQAGMPGMVAFRPSCLEIHPPCMPIICDMKKAAIKMISNGLGALHSHCDVGICHYKIQRRCMIVLILTPALMGSSSGYTGIIRDWRPFC
jgi:hypothetical protein